MHGIEQRYEEGKERKMEENWRNVKLAKSQISELFGNLVRSPPAWVLSETKPFQNHSIVIKNEPFPFVRGFCFLPEQ